MKNEKYKKPTKTRLKKRLKHQKEFLDKWNRVELEIQRIYEVINEKSKKQKS